ncbi:hypothetical protein [Sphaerisporangium dianthi]|uniref:Uncharacterized protein n=1 Tax=Sphaerisporangium dianthi TaxID=1436120 RepID=A0ABV9CAE3_9ACTN
MSELMRVPLADGGGQVVVKIADDEPAGRRASRTGDKLEGHLNVTLTWRRVAES